MDGLDVVQSGVERVGIFACVSDDECTIGGRVEFQPVVLPGPWKLDGVMVIPAINDVCAVLDLKRVIA